MIGQVFDERYRIVRKLGEGGMGEVFLAEHINLGRQDALKVLREDMATDPEFVARFRREARATNRLQHPNIVAVYDFGKLEGGRFYLAMELITGERLDGVVRRGPLPVARVLRILAQLADAVDHAHSRGVVHRDLKPENLLLVEHRGRADILKVLDFGIAKILKGDSQDAVTLSHKGKIYGTPAFMPPEAFADGVVDPRVDLYAIGCIAFDLLVGEPPFVGNMLQLMEQHMMKTPDRPSARRPGARIPAELDEIVLRCLAKKPSERFQTGRDLYLALDRLQAETARSPSGRRTSYSLGVPARTDGGDTVSATDFSSGGPRPDASGKTEPLSSAVAVRAIQEVVRALAQSLCDLGGRHAGLLLALTRIKQLDDDLAHTEAQQAALEALSDDLEEAARAREASLRFALGELHYERAQAVERGETPDGALDREIHSFEVQVAKIPADLERALSPTVDHSITLAAARSEIEEVASSLYGELERRVEEVLPRFADERTIAPMVSRLRSIRSAIPRSKR
jgi:serine/threonine protein kinase